MGLRDNALRQHSGRLRRVGHLAGDQHEPVSFDRMAEWGNRLRAAGNHVKFHGSSLGDSQVSFGPAKTRLLNIACTPQLPSTTWVTPKSTAAEISAIASSSLNPLVFIRKRRTFRNASFIARSSEDFA